MDPATYVRTAGVPLAQLRPFPGNAKRGNVGAILESLCRNGQYRSVVARETGGDLLTALAGNHTVQAIAAHGPGDCGMTVQVGDEERPCGLCSNAPWEPVVRCEVVQCSDDTARRINLVDNRAAELGDWDEQALAELIAPLHDDLGGTGYSEADVDDLVRAVTAAVEEDEPEDPYDDEHQDQAVAEPPPTPALAPAAPSSSAAPVPPGGAPPVFRDGTTSSGGTAQFSHERVPMVLHYETPDRDEAARLVTAAREVFPGEEAPTIVLRSLRTLVAVLDSRHAHDGVVTVSALLRAAGVER
ncbi:hypothetical protein [Streptomyces sp. NPDC088847]|uniref:hypothetical protein n=1 Tax=Streptomyces sp. NPDC088847 TaxID=3365909 RepID=UPI00381C6C36